MYNKDIIYLENLKKYIYCNKNYLYLLKNNKFKDFYIKEDEIITLFDLRNVRYNILISELYKYDKEV